MISLRAMHLLSSRRSGQVSFLQPRSRSWPLLHPGPHIGFDIDVCSSSLPTLSDTQHSRYSKLLSHTLIADNDVPVLPAVPDALLQQWQSTSTDFQHQ